MAGKTFEIAFKLAGQLSGNFAKTFKAAQDAVSGFSGRIDELNRQASAVSGVVKMRKECAELSAKAGNYRKALDAVTQSIQRSKSPTKEQLSLQKQLEGQYQRTKASLDKKRAALKAAEASAGTNGKSLQTLIARNDALAKSVERARAAQEQQRAAMSRMQANNAALSANAGYASMTGAGIGAGLISAVKTGAAFEEQMAKVAAVSRASDEELARLTAQAKELGKSTVWSSSQAAEGMQYLAMAGFKTEDTLKAMPGMLNLASAGAIDLARAADISSNILTGFGLSAEEIGRVGDVLTNTFTSSNTSLEMLGATMKYAAPIAKAMGVSIEEAAAMAGKLGDAGIQGEMAGTTLRAVMLKLSAPTKAAAEALKDLGVKTTDAQGNMRKYPDILADIQKATEGMSEAQKTAYVKAIFETEAMSGAMVLMEQAGSGALQKYVTSLNEMGSATRVARKQNDNLSGDFKGLSSAIEGTALQIYDQMQPALRGLTQWATSTVSAIGQWADSHQGLIQALTFTAGGIGALTAAAFPMLVAVKTATFVWSAFQAPILAVNAAVKTVRTGWLLYRGAVVAGTAVTNGAIVVQKAFQTVAATGTAVMKGLRAAQLGLNLAMKANPIGLIVTLLGGLVLAGVEVCKNWDTIKETLSGLWSSFSEKFPGIAQVVESWALKIGGIVEEVKGFFSGLTDYVKNIFSVDLAGTWNKITSFFGGKSSVEVNASAQQNARTGSIAAAQAYDLPTLASGGIATQTTLAMIGEGRESEAVLPLSKLDSMMGGGGGSNVTVNMTVNVSGTSQDAYADIKRGISDGARDLKRELERLMSNQRRLSFS